MGSLRCTLLPKCQNLLQSRKQTWLHMVSLFNLCSSLSGTMMRSHLYQLLPSFLMDTNFFFVAPWVSEQFCLLIKTTNTRGGVTVDLWYLTFLTHQTGHSFLDQGSDSSLVMLIYPWHFYIINYISLFIFLCIWCVYVCACACIPVWIHVHLCHGASIWWSEDKLKFRYLSTLIDPGCSRPLIFHRPSVNVSHLLLRTLILKPMLHYHLLSWFWEFELRSLCLLYPLSHLTNSYL